MTTKLLHWHSIMVMAVWNHHSSIQARNDDRERLKKDISVQVTVSSPDTSAIKDVSKFQYCCVHSKNDHSFLWETKSNLQKQQCRENLNWITEGNRTLILKDFQPVESNNQQESTQCMKPGQTSKLPRGLSCRCRRSRGERGFTWQDQIWQP